LTAIKHNYICN